MFSSRDIGLPNEAFHGFPAGASVHKLFVGGVGRSLYSMKKILLACIFIEEDKFDIHIDIHVSWSQLQKAKLC